MTINNEIYSFQSFFFLPGKTAAQQDDSRLMSYATSVFLVVIYLASNQAFGKTDDYGSFSVKKVKTKFLGN